MSRTFMPITSHWGWEQSVRRDRRDGATNVDLS